MQAGVPDQFNCVSDEERAGQREPERCDAFGREAAVDEENERGEEQTSDERKTGDEYVAGRLLGLDPPEARSGREKKREAHREAENGRDDRMREKRCGTIDRRGRQLPLPLLLTEPARRALQDRPAAARRALRTRAHATCGAHSDGSKPGGLGKRPYRTGSPRVRQGRSAGRMTGTSASRGESRARLPRSRRSHSAASSSA